jgi:5'-AMP-activated protein kinase, catalytic alpha subunit
MKNFHQIMKKLVNFGLSNTFKPVQLLKTACGSPSYAAPDMNAGNKYHGSKVDV